MREENLGKVKEILFSTNRVPDKEGLAPEMKVVLTTTELALDVYCLLLNNGSGQLDANNLKILLNLSREHSYDLISVESMVNAAWCVVIYDPTCANDWIHILTEPFSFETGKDACCHADFKKACLLAIFKIASWLDQEGKSNPRFEKEFLSIVKEFILINNSEIKHLSDYLDSKIESQLSQFIKGWLKGQPRRFKKYIQLINEVKPKLEADEKNFNKIGLIIFDQIFYSCWSQISRHGKANALHLLPDKFYPTYIE